MSAGDINALLDHVSTGPAIQREWELSSVNAAHRCGAYTRWT